jgi:hypothetical protein
VLVAGAILPHGVHVDEHFGLVTATRVGEAEVDRGLAALGVSWGAELLAYEVPSY